MFHRILFPTDGSGLSLKAADVAVDLAAALHADLVVLYVVPRYPTAYFEGGFALEMDQVARVERSWAEIGQCAVDQVRDLAGARGLEVKAVTLASDHVADAILSATRKHGCDLVVMASHARKGVRRMLLGSEMQHVLDQGDTAVLVIH
ncbi:MAG TPA: universal stress protein [Ramlibacter sp.]|nr:universal stress protein [Ramlibacter sp.]